MIELLKKFENKSPEIVFEWKDSETEAEGWVVINSLRGGAAGGGTRMRKGLDKREVESLAKTMEIKFTVAGPPIGGAKSGINFDPHDPRKKEVLERWYKAVAPLLKNYYGTGGDLNIDEVHEVIPITRSLGVLHPQEGVVNGHFHADPSARNKIISNLQTGVSKVLNDVRFSPDATKKIVVADMITGYGVAESVLHYYLLKGEELKGKKVIVQGWGNVGSAAAYYLAQKGALVVAIIDREGGLINEDGYSYKEIRKLFLEKDGNKLRTENMIPLHIINEKVWDVKADIFLPCAASRLVTREQVDRMISAGVNVISCGANVPFADPEIFFGPIGEYTDKKISLIPDFIANCGMARVFAYLMNPAAIIVDENIFNDVSETIHAALLKTMAKNNTGKDLARTAFEIALNELMSN
jgi:glutamate dehydrogenase/leucine dehydrogenase